MSEHDQDSQHQFFSQILKISETIQFFKMCEKKLVVRILCFGICEGLLPLRLDWDPNSTCNKDWKNPKIPFGSREVLC